LLYTLARNFSALARLLKVSSNDNLSFGTWSKYFLHEVVAVNTNIAANKNIFFIMMNCYWLKFQVKA
jgi:hypothetical protein